MWSPQEASGTLPPPINRSTLTMIDDHRAVLFGGRQKEYRTHGVYVLDLAKMVGTFDTTCLMFTVSEPWCSKT